MKHITYQIKTIVPSTIGGHDSVVILQEKSITCADGALDVNLDLAKSESYNGEISVEDYDQPDPGPVVETVTYAELAAAIREGVNRV